MSEIIKPQQHRFLVALLGATTTGAAIEAAQVNERTAYRWLADPVFRSALSQAEAQRGLMSIAKTAVETLGSVMGDKSVHAGVRLRAADIALGHLLKLRELT